MRKLNLGLTLSHFLVVAAMAQSTISRPVYDGKWWLSENNERQAGFLEGASNCLTWVAHEDGFNGTPDQLQAKMTAYYKTRPTQKSELVTQVWQDVWHDLSSKKPTKQPAGGETWNNPHWYLDGLWWGQISKDEEEGFLDGFLWCMRSHVKSAAEDYPLSTASYLHKIDAYLQKHPGADREPVAVILSHFRARSTSK